MAFAHGQDPTGRMLMVTEGRTARRPDVVDPLTEGHLAVLNSDRRFSG